jgi:hypothetical protein
MTTEQLKRANEISKNVSEIVEIRKHLESIKSREVYAIRDAHGYTNLNPAMTTHPTLQLKINEILETALDMIENACNKESKKLEREFDSL